MNPVYKPANEPEPRGMSTALDLDAETGTPAKIPGEGEETAGALGHFA